MLSGIMAKISAALAVVAGVLFVLLGMEKSRRKKAEHKNKVNEKIKEIDLEQRDFEQEVQEDEKKRIDERVEESSNNSRRDRLSKL